VILTYEWKRSTLFNANISDGRENDVLVMYGGMGGARYGWRGGSLKGKLRRASKLLN
jgi:hypothetical protein